MQYTTNGGTKLSLKATAFLIKPGYEGSGEPKAAGPAGPAVPDFGRHVKKKREHSKENEPPKKQQKQPEGPASEGEAE